MLKHQFKTKAHNLHGLFEGTDNFRQFMRKLEKQARIDPDRYELRKYLGDGFEFFVELLLYLHPVDNRLGVYQYKPVQENDNGVDGVGVNIRGEDCVVQVKYRSNTASTLTATKDHLGNFITDGMMAYNVVVDAKDTKNYRHFVFTTAAGLHHYTDQEMFKSRVKCFNIRDIRGLVDHNLPFWDAARDITGGIVC